MFYGDIQPTAAKRWGATMAAAVVGLACGAALAGPPAAAAATVSPLPASDYGVRPVCAAPEPGHVACLADELVPQTPAARAHTRPLGMTRDAPANARPGAGVCEQPTAAQGCYGLRPQDLHGAYRLPAGAQSPQTIAIVDPYNDPSAEADLGKYDQEFGLPACTAQNGCFQQVNGKGEPAKTNEKGEATNLPFPVSVSQRQQFEVICRTSKSSICEAIEWNIEISLDIQTAHGICGNCRILLVEAASSELPSLEEAEESAARLGANEISDSWGQPERAGVSEAFNHPGLVITAAAGDDGYLNWRGPPAEQGSVNYPASSPHVVAVGGTRLRLQEGAWKEETVWNGQGATGGGCSQLYAAPPWQLTTPDWSETGCGQKRAVSDVSADADPDTGVAVYYSGSRCEAHWCTLGGTSLASPLIAAVFALAGGANGVEYPASTLYEKELSSPRSLHDVVAGSNGACREPPNSEGVAPCSAAAEAASCSQRAICLAGPGYDGPSGVGTPNGIAAFSPFAASPNQEPGPAPALPPAEPERTSTVSSTTNPGQSPQTTPAGGASGPPAPTGTGAPLTVQISQLALTARAVSALHRARPTASKIGFTFSISAAAQVRATLARRVRVKGKVRWKRVANSITITASKGRNSLSLRGRNRLAPGSYRLTLTPSRGIGQSIVVTLR